jgi:hypothetical protein
LLAGAIPLVGASPGLGHELEPETDRDLARMEARQAMAGISANARAVPRADCGPGSRPEPGMQGRVPRGSPEAGFTCNTRLLGSQGKAGGYKVHRFVDRSGRECAYYDTTLLFPSNVQHLSNQPTGVAVLDMTDPSKPVQTDMLSTPAMQTPHESMVLNERRGLLAAVMGNPTFYPGFIDIYDVNEDCRHPSLKSSLPVGLLGHESGFAPDGNTFYATSLSTGHITAVDVSNPSLPVTLWNGEYRSHGLTVSEDGNRAYVAANTGLLILDVSEVQARKPNPQVKEVSRLTWDELTIPQVAIPVTIGGRRFLVEIDEFSGTETSTGPAENGSKVGAARIIDIQNEQAPRVVSNIRLEVHQPENREQLRGDPGASSSLQGYAGHYCAVPRRKEPGIVACSFIASGLRVFDIRDPYQPREIAYFVAPLTHSSTAGEPSNYAMSAPAFASERGEIWHSDGNTGFHAVRLTNDARQIARRRNSCMGRRTRVGSRSIGRAQLGLTRSRMLRRVRPAPVRRGRRVVRWCVTGTRGRVSAVFSRPGPRGRARLVVSTARRHTAGRPGRVARRFPRARRLSRGVYRGGPRSRRVFGVRRGRLRFVGVADTRLLRNPKALRRYLRRAGL